MGTTHAAGWIETGAELVGIAAETVEEAQPLATQYRLKVYPDLASLLPDVDVVDVCTPTHLHYPMVMESAAAGKHIICEKPLARSVEQARRMVSECRTAGVQLLVAHVVRYFPEYAQAHKLIAEGVIGRPAVLRLTRGSYRPKKPVGNWFLDEEKSGGILMDLMIHDYDYARWLAGDVQSVYARRIPSQDAGSVNYGLVILRHTGGALSHIAGAWAYPPPVFRTGFELAGDEGLIEFSSDDTAPIRNLTLKAAGDAPDVALPSSPVSESPYTTQIKEFYAALCGEGTARISAGDGLAAVQIAEAAIQSASTGKAVELEQLAEVSA
jgi:predicted dehydrogenase